MSRPPERRVQPPTEEDLSQIAGWVDWIAGHRDPPPDPAATEEFLRFLGALLKVDFAREWGWNELYAAGMALGEVLRRRHSWQWVVVEDDEGRDLALQVPDDPITGTEAIKVFPGHMVARHQGKPDMIDIADYEHFLMHPERWEER